MTRADLVKAEWQREPGEGWKTLAERMEALSRDLEASAAAQAEVPDELRPNEQVVEAARRLSRSTSLSRRQEDVTEILGYVNTIIDRAAVPSWAYDPSFDMSGITRAYDLYVQASASTFRPDVEAAITLLSRIEGRVQRALAYWHKHRGTDQGGPAYNVGAGADADGVAEPDRLPARAQP